ncbi:16378_t:CDS:2 [Dentiscutata erythropus]|uniref:16378_t:CDS:1 n=1 Tax=Dentiscutata erythropus TaxID=1348616 RepID=A0A9N9BLN3_9GLOM|nr:16378_t:CDS:2 [Dentiscutata erythropus]
MDKCTSCSRRYPPELFIYKGKTYKTCNNCLTSKAEKKIKLNNDTKPIIETISLQVLSEFVAKLISDVEHNNGISFEARIDLNDDIFPITNLDLKSIARVILDKVEEGDDYPQSSTVLSADGDEERIDPNLYQQCETKVVALEYLVKHLREELSANNIKHIKNVINNMDRVFTMINDIKSSQLNIRRDNTWNSKPWTMFL